MLNIYFGNGNYERMWTSNHSEISKQIKKALERFYFYQEVKKVLLVGVNAYKQAERARYPEMSNSGKPNLGITKSHQHGLKAHSIGENLCLIL